MKNLDGKAALVTGSTSGIGLGMARSLASQGCNIMLNGFGDVDEIEKIRSNLETDFGIKVAYNRANMAVPSEIRGIVTKTVEAFGTLHILVNNAGIQRTNPIEDFGDQDWDDIIAINMSSVFHSMKAALPHMRTAGWGRIINTASVHGLIASVQKTAYVAAKHGVVGMTKVIALETAKEKITCNAICPGWVKTELIEKQIEIRAKDMGISLEEATKNLLQEKQPSMEFATPDDLGQLLLFLCSPAANQMTGTALPMDGGWTAQ